MDVVTQSLLKEFAESQKIDGPQSDQFEAFTNYTDLRKFLDTGVFIFGDGSIAGPRL
jgi:hypothetical protein